MQVALLCTTGAVDTKSKAGAHGSAGRHQRTSGLDCKVTKTQGFFSWGSLLGGTAQTVSVGLCTIIIYNT